MILFKDHLKEVIQIAVGIGESGWYVQTTDVATDTYYAERIEEGLKTKEDALAIANHYANVFNLEVVVWDEGMVEDNSNDDLYIYYHCDEWKMVNSMRVAGIYNDFQLLKERLWLDHNEGTIDTNGIEEITVDNVNNAQYVHVEIVKPNEEL